MLNPGFLINQGLFQLSWPACVIGAAYGWIWGGLVIVGALAMWQLHPANRHPLDLRMVATCLGLGLVLDTAWIQLGLLEFAAPWPWPGVAPVWIMLLWLALALVVNHSMGLFKNRLLLIGVLGGIGSPMSYFAGSRFGAVEWVAPAWQVVLATGLSWALVLPLLFWMARRHDQITVQPPVSAGAQNP
ncbi:MAG: DUF2878 domain-containing protein [Wenzhouxiangella sp.]|nr:MAG: DUF2878 domain-containing protein [Wenzhouxiangella sp.]